MAMTISQLAREGEVNIQTIRYYERRGLIAEPGRTPAGYRQYTDDAARRLRFIRRAKQLGFTLEEIRDLLALRVDHRSACDSVAQKTHDKIRLVDEKIDELQALRKVLNHLVAACDANEPTGDCPIIERLEDQSGRLSEEP